MRLKIVSDTSFLISLAVINMEKILLRYFDVKITAQVLDELKRVSKHEDEEGKAARKLLRLVDRGFADIIPIVPTRMKGMGRGESSVLAAFKKGGFDYLATDDLEAMDKIVKETGEGKIVITYDILEVLVRKKFLSVSRARKLVKRLLKLRHWDLSKTLLEAAKKRGLT